LRLPSEKLALDQVQGREGPVALQAVWVQGRRRAQSKGPPRAHREPDHRRPGGEERRPADGQGLVRVCGSTAGATRAW
jgi:hypothetical protein